MPLVVGCFGSGQQGVYGTIARFRGISLTSLAEPGAGKGRVDREGDDEEGLQRESHDGLLLGDDGQVQEQDGVCGNFKQA